jgi:hypothetical protein
MFAGRSGCDGKPHMTVAYRPPPGLTALFVLVALTIALSVRNPITRLIVPERGEWYSQFRPSSVW